MKQIPNLLTVFRFILTLFFIQFLTKPGLYPTVMAAVIFFCASLTDYYDGYLAKKYQWVTNFGKIMDPIADKFLVLAAFYIFAHIQMIPYWMFFLIFLREILVTGSRLVAVSQGRVLAAEQAGKYKTVAQMVAIVVTLGFMIFKQTELAVHSPLMVMQGWTGIVAVLMWIALGLTLFSGFLFFWHNRRLNEI